jgi:hypothetical protein
MKKRNRRTRPQKTESRALDLPRGAELAALSPLADPVIAAIARLSPFTQ